MHVRSVLAVTAGVCWCVPFGLLPICVTEVHFLCLYYIFIVNKLHVFVRKTGVVVSGAVAI